MLLQPAGPSLQGSAPALQDTLGRRQDPSVSITFINLLTLNAEAMYSWHVLIKKALG